VRKKAQEAVKYIRDHAKTTPKIGIILGTGLGKLIKSIAIEKTLKYDCIPHFPDATVESHKGRLILGHLKRKAIVAMQGRFHYYEGYSAKEITLPVLVMKMLGVRTLIVSNACGGLNPDFATGELMLIKDHINLIPDNPLRGVFATRAPVRPNLIALSRVRVLAVRDNVILDLRYEARDIDQDITSQAKIDQWYNY